MRTNNLHTGRLVVTCQQHSRCVAIAYYSLLRFRAATRGVGARAAEEPREDRVVRSEHAWLLTDDAKGPGVEEMKEAPRDEAKGLTSL